MSKAGSLALAIAAALSATLLAAAATTTVAQLLAFPSSFDGKHVDVKGQVQKLAQTASPSGSPSVTFSLCTNQCVQVIGFGSPGISNGQTVVVHGMFSAVKEVRGYIFFDKIDAGAGSP